jgi:Flp pilus assembly protein TadG
MRPFCFNNAGMVAPVIALGLPVFIGMAALSFDTSWMYYQKAKLHTAADAAARGAALALANPTIATDRAVSLAAANVPASFGTVTTSSDVTYGTYNTVTKTFSPSSSSINAVQVVAKRNGSRTFFGAIFGISAVNISATSVAVNAGPSACFIALDPTVSTGLSISGSGTLSVPHCGVWVNSSSPTALTTGTASTASALAFSTVGGFTGSGFTPVPKAGTSAITDPMAALPEPSTPSNCTVNGLHESGTVTLYPGTYCGKISIVGSGTVTLNPGVYYLQSADLQVANSASLTAAGVMLFLDANSSMKITSSGTISLSSPTSGLYKGIAIFQSRTANLNATNSISGGNNIFIDGKIYTPKSTLQMTGASTLSDTAKVGYVISGAFSYSGNSTFNFDAYSGGIPSSLSSGSVLVN